MLKNDFFGFHKVKWLSLTGEVDKSAKHSCQIFSGFNIPKIIKIGWSLTELFKIIKSWTFWGTQSRNPHRPHQHNETGQTTNKIEVSVTRWYTWIFLFDFNTKCASILCRFRDIASELSKVVDFNPLPAFYAPVRGDPGRISRKFSSSEN